MNSSQFVIPLPQIKFVVNDNTATLFVSTQGPQGPSGTPITVKIVDASLTGYVYQMLANDAKIVIKNTTPGATSVLTPVSPITGHDYQVIDGGLNASEYNITINATNGTFYGQDSILMRSNGADYKFFNDGDGEWWL